MPNQTKRRKVDQSLKYRWGVVGTILAVGFFVWYIQTSGDQRNTDKPDYLENYVKIICPRCKGIKNPDKTCSLCNGRGFIWVDKTREDLPDEIIIP